MKEAIIRYDENDFDGIPLFKVHRDGTVTVEITEGLDLSNMIGKDCNFKNEENSWTEGDYTLFGFGKKCFIDEDGDEWEKARCSKTKIEIKKPW